MIWASGDVPSWFGSAYNNFDAAKVEVDSVYKQGHTVVQMAHYRCDSMGSIEVIEFEVHSN